MQSNVQRVLDGDQPGGVIVKAADILKGAWSARWGNWVVRLRALGNGWEATVWRWAPDAPLTDRVEIDQWDGFRTTEEAVSWACTTMRGDGARVFVLDAPKPISLESLLRFNPAPEACA